MAIESITLHDIQTVHDTAASSLEEAHQGRIDPLISASHPDHWLADVPDYVAACAQSGRFSRQYDSLNGTPIGQRVWQPTAAAAYVVSKSLLS